MVNFRYNIYLNLQRKKGLKLHKKLMVSTSGIRGVVGAGLEPDMVTRYAAAFGTHLKKGTVVLGRDSRPSGACDARRERRARLR